MAKLPTVYYKLQRPHAPNPKSGIATAEARKISRLIWCEFQVSYHWAFQATNLNLAFQSL